IRIHIHRPQHDMSAGNRLSGREHDPPGQRSIHSRLAHRSHAETQYGDTHYGSKSATWLYSSAMHHKSSEEYRERTVSRSFWEAPSPVDLRKVRRTLDLAVD
ncbi:MAG: hypothetical protein ABI147_12245, partial [Acidobacteriaceae bacterium]